MAATRSEVLLPHPSELERTCKGLATLDAIMASEWEDRYYSFNAAWDTAQNVRMASMRNGSGDTWFIAFTPTGTFVKAFWHEHAHGDAAAIYAGLPEALVPQRDEPAFETHLVTWGGWHDGTTWTLRGDATPMEHELAILSGAATAYRDYAADYFEATLPLPAIEHVLAGRALTAAVVAQLDGEMDLEALTADLTEIGY
jgi:hypothetical protein